MSKRLTGKELEYFVNHSSDLESDEADEVHDEDFNSDPIEDDCPDSADLSESDKEEVASENSDVQSGSDSDELLPRDNSDIPNIMIGEDGTQWFREPPPQNRNRSTDIIAASKLNGRILEDPLDTFLLYIDDDVVDSIVEFTNLEENRARGQRKPWRACDKIEMYAFIGLLLMAGHMKQHHTSYVELWNPVYGAPIFRATMSIQRFKSLLRFIRFDDGATRSDRRKSDKFAPFRDIWEKVNHKLGRYYTPGPNITVDEQLVPFRGRVPFRQYSPSKPDKYGMKIWWVCDSATFYPLKGLPYLGKEPGRNASQVVETLTEPYYFTNRNITCNNYFTNLHLALSMLSKGLTLVGTVKKNGTFLPRQFLPNKNKTLNSSMFGYTEQCTLASHVPKLNKSVILLSTMHSNASIDEGKDNPELNSHYNSTKGAVDSLDQLCHEYTCKRKSDRWPFVYFCHSLDVCGVAAYVIWTTAYPDWNTKRKDKRREFLKTVSEKLVMPQIERRERCTFERPLEGPASSGQSRQPISHKRKRCFICPARKSRIQKQVCDRCHQNVCNEHSQSTRICDQCV